MADAASQSAYRKIYPPGPDDDGARFELCEEDRDRDYCFIVCLEMEDKSIAFNTLNSLY